MESGDRDRHVLAQEACDVVESDDGVDGPARRGG